MKNILEQFFLYLVFLNYSMSAISTFDRVMYEDTNHFIGFIIIMGCGHF